jgi:hypothetical protein
MRQMSSVGHAARQTQKSYRALQRVQDAHFTSEKAFASVAANDLPAV